MKKTLLVTGQQLETIEYELVLIGSFHALIVPASSVFSTRPLQPTYPMIFHLFASGGFTPPAIVPDSGMTGLMLGAAILAVGVFARFVKNRKK